MPTRRPLPRALSVVAGERNRAADAALLEALPHAAPEVQGAILEALVQREHTLTLLALVVRLRSLDASLQAMVVRKVGAFHSAIRAAIASSALEDRAAAIHLITAGGDARLAYLLTDALRSPCPRTRELAAGALYDLTQRVIEASQAAPAGSQAAGAVRTDDLAEALRDVVARWELHFQPKALEAALWLFDGVEPAISEKIREPQTKIVHMLHEIIAGASDPKLAPAVWRALTFPELRGAAAGAITRAKNPLFIRALLREAWVLADHEVERGLRWVAEGPWLDDWTVELPNLDDHAAARMAPLVAAAGGSPERKTERFRTMLGWPRTAIRREVLWHLVHDPSDGATDLLQLLAARSGDSLSAVAARECRRRRPAPTGATSHAPEAAGAADDPLAGLFVDAEPPVPFDREQRLRALRGDPGVTRLLRERLRSPDPVHRGRALNLAKELGLLGTMEEEIYRLSGDRDRVVRAAAIAMLANLPGPTTTRILRAALHDPDDRVQANAIEALDRLKVRDCIESIRPKLASSNSRVRANAVQALLRVEVREAGGALLDMLESPTEAQRISALWVIGRMQLRSVLHRVLELSRKDPDERVRRRAQRVLAALTAANDSWPVASSRGQLASS